MTLFQTLLRTKSQSSQPPSQLHRCLNAVDLTLLGVGAIIGAGIFVLTGVAAAQYAGPAIIISFLLAGLTATFSALAYAELASSIGGVGSAYNYAYTGLGELLAWIIGWDLLLEYGMSCSTVAIGWSGYADNALIAVGIHLPTLLTNDITQGGLINLPASLIIILITLLLIVGIRQSASFNHFMVLIKLAVIIIFIIIAAFHFDPAKWHPFFPFGIHGMVRGAALIFFAYIGFDAISTTTEEALRPERDVPIGIIISVTISTLIYMIVAGLLTGMLHYTKLNVSSPVSYALLQAGYRFAGAIVAIGAIAGLTTVILVMFYGFTRIFLAMARDGLLPAASAKINSKTKTPIRIIAGSGIIMAVVAGTMPIHRVAELVNIGTLAAFALVCASVIILRYTKPHLKRPFKTPFSPLIPVCGMSLSLYLMCTLPSVSWLRFICWMVLGLIIYFSYSRFHSALAK